jgi:hypothetical protein
MKNVESFYPLSPMQEGMLYHTMYAPGSGAYMGQVTFRLTGAHDLDAFRRAWQAVIERHPSLRTIFLWKGVKTPVQVVRREVELPVEMLDWRGLDAGAHEARLREQLERERARGFDLTRAPLMRLAVIRLDGGDTQFVWSYHHLILDGWSVSSLFGEVAACFQAFARGARAPGLAPARPYRDYIVWLQRQDTAEAEQFWRRELEGASVPTPVPARPAPDGGGEPARQEFKLLRLTDAELSALQAYARRQRLTVNTVAQGAWGLLLSHLGDRRDVVFGATVSGRPPELAGVEGMVGMFINTLPVRLRVSPDEALAPWLRALQARQVESRRFEYCSLRQIQTWCGGARGARLYDSLLAFHNYPGRITPAPSGGDGEGGTPAGGGGAGLGDVRAMSQLAYPLEMEVMPAAEATVLTLRYDAGRVAAADVERVMGGFAALLRGAGRWEYDATVGQLLELLRDEDRRRQASQAEAYDEAAAKKLKGLRGLRARPQATPAAPTTAKG